MVVNYTLSSSALAHFPDHCCLILSSIANFSQIDATYADMFAQAVGAKDIDLILARIKGPDDRMKLIRRMYSSFSGEKIFPKVLRDKITRIENLRGVRNSFCHDLWGIDSHGNLISAHSSFASPGSRSVTLSLDDFTKISRLIEELLFNDQYKKVNEEIVALLHAAAEPVIKHKGEFFSSTMGRFQASPAVLDIPRLRGYQTKSLQAYHTAVAVQVCLDRQRDRPEWLWEALEGNDLLERPWHEYSKKEG